MRLLVVCLTVMASLGWVSRAMAGPGDGLGDIIKNGIGGELENALCPKDSATQKLLKSIDGFAIGGAGTLKYGVGGGCEMTFWKMRNPPDNSRMRTQNYCFPSVTLGVSSKFSAYISIIYGCNGDPENYKGYFASASVAGFQHHWGVGDGFFEDTAVFLGLASRAKGSAGASLDEMISKFKDSRSKIDAQLKELEKNPAAKLALKGYRGKFFHGEKGLIPTDVLLADLIANQRDFLEGTNELIPRMEALRREIARVNGMSKGPARTKAEGLVVKDAAELGRLLDGFKLGASQSGTCQRI